MIKFYLEITEAIKIAKALTPCMSKDTTRYYLNGVCLDASREGLFAVASDGHRLGKLKLSPLGEDGLPLTEEQNFSKIIPTGAVNFLYKLKPQKGNGAEYVSFDIEGGKLTLSVISQSINASFLLVDGDFINWRTIMPSYTPYAVVAFNATYLAELCKAAHQVSENRTTVINFHIGNASAPATLEVNDQLSYVLMPARF